MKAMVRLCVVGSLAWSSAGCCPAAGSAHDAPPHAVVASGEEGADGHARVTAVMEGRASYYADSLAGNHTANGEVYNPRALTAASRTLPFGTRVRVTRLDNGRSVVVRINDRGPFGRRRRIMDLSRAAAERLDMLGAGVVEVRAEVLGR